MIEHPITLFNREEMSQSKEKDIELLRLIYPRLPYHLRCDYYMKKRNEIFNSIGALNKNKGKPKRSTRRIREYYAKRRFCRKYLVSTIVTNTKDQRFYAKVN